MVYQNSGETLDKLKARDFNATTLSTFVFPTLYTTLPHNLIKDKLIDLIERTFQREGSPYLACNDRNAFFTSEKPKNIMHGRVKRISSDKASNVPKRDGRFILLK